MSMNGNFFSHFIDHLLICTQWIMKLLKVALKVHLLHATVHFRMG